MRSLGGVCCKSEFVLYIDMSICPPYSPVLEEYILRSAMLITMCAVQNTSSPTTCSYSQFVMHKHVLFVLIKPRTCGVGGVCDEDSHNFTVFLAICPSYRLGHVEKEECEVRIVKDPTVCAVHDTSSQATC